ncbi:hypothetical protein AWW66_08260 [Micromonospora rosaria]|uniref:N-acetylglutamate synthase n=1 Tax=Micromonospora rosaria TaxID=47874 RepID=A0A136PVC7_9ACTN|nr:hypothetical protein [Micromonospora rosaria]KXK62428.1 hypothetical protein AWW66_08260 [Micromonospora rosaria]
MSINYDGRRFRKVGAGPDEAATALYRQDGDLVWGQFSGGDVRQGSLTGRADPVGRIDFTYTMVLRDGKVIAGRCRSTPQVLPNGRIRLDEDWERFGTEADQGTSAIEEVS